MIKKIVSTFLLAICCCTIAIAQNINRAKLDSLFTTLSENKKAMGSIAISKNKKLQYTRAIGYTAMSDGKWMFATPETKYRIGSITKMFTAVIILQLIEEHKLELTTTVDKLFTGIPNGKKITIGYLLGHRSGLHNFTNDSSYTKWMEKPKTKMEMLRIIANGGKFDSYPGIKAHYSNSNYVLLGFIIEQVCKKPYSTVLNERIISKLKLKNTYYGGPISPEKNESRSYDYINDWQVTPETDMSIPGGAGAIVSTPSDLTQFIESLFTGKLVNEKSLLHMTTIVDGYGMGMFQFPFGNRKAYGHTGGIDGFHSMLAYFPDDSVAIAYCSNGEVYGLNDIILGSLNIFYGIDYNIPVFKSISLKSEELDRYTGIYSSSQIPLKITITKVKNALVAQATGQPTFPLTATDTDKFSFEQAGVIIEFDVSKQQMTLMQGGGKYTFTKDK